MPDVPTALVFTGMACGALLAAAGLALWGGPRQMSRLPLATRAIRWLAEAFLLIGVLFAWLGEGDPSFSTPTSRLILMAALAAPPEPHRRHYSYWDNVILILPALVLAGASLFWRSEPVGIEMSSLPVVVVEVAVVVCSGLGARALGQGLSEVIASSPHVERPPLPTATTYALLTLLVGGTVLVNLWQRGSVWGGTTYEGGLAGAWLAWSAVWLSPRRPLWLRAVLTTTAALLLIVLAVGW